MNQKMKIMGLVVALIAGFTFNTNADTNFRWWNTAAGNLQDNVSADILAGDATVLTYLSSDSTINFDAATLLANSYGNDFYYQALTTGFDGRLTTTLMAETGDPGYNGYFAYAVVLDMSLTTFNTTYNGNVDEVPVGTYYAITTISTALTDQDGGLGTPDSFNYMGNLTTNQQVVPEPATAMLLAFGGGLAWLVRMKQRMI